MRLPLSILPLSKRQRTHRRGVFRIEQLEDRIVPALALDEAPVLPLGAGAAGAGQAPTAEIAGPSTAVRGFEKAFTLTATEAGAGPDAEFTFHIDWDGDGTVDQEIVGQSGLEVRHTFATSGVFAIGLVAVDQDGDSSDEVLHSLAVTSWAKEADNTDPTKMNLLVGGTDDADAVAFFSAGGDAVTFYAYTYGGADENVTVDGITGKIIAAGLGGIDHLLAFDITQTVEFHGGAGGDVLAAGPVGGMLDGGADRDILIGNLQLGLGGPVQFDAGTGEDLVVSGSLHFHDFGDLYVRLQTLRAEWVAERSLAERVATLTGGADPIILPGVSVNPGLAANAIERGDAFDWLVIDTARDTVTPPPGSDDLLTPIVGAAVSLSAGLANDAGLSSTDGLTFDPAIAGIVTSAHPVTALRVGFADRQISEAADATADLQADGTFSLSRARLEALLGGSLADGSYTLRFQAGDDQGHVSNFVDVSFTLETVPPAAPVFDLSVTSDTGTPGDQSTSVATVTLAGQTSPNVLVTAVGTGAAAMSTNSGSFLLPGVPLALGTNLLTLRALDAAGNSADHQLAIERTVAAASQNVVLEWNQILLEAVRLDASSPTVATRAMAMVQGAVFDALAAIEGTAGYFVKVTAPAGASPSPEAAVAAAAHRVLSYLYPFQQTQQMGFDARLAQTLAAIADGPGKDDGVALGRTVADAVIELRKSDGWDTFIAYTPGSEPGDWRETPPMYVVALTPQWANLRPFAMTSPSQFLPDGPPDLTSAEYAAAWDEVRRLGRADSTERTVDQTRAARFWADGAGTYTPPGHWNQIAAQFARAQGNSLIDDARLFAQLNITLADAAIVAWNAKFDYEFWRPVTAIREADTDGNDATTADESWSSLIVSPPFPEYTSGHSTFSGAAEVVLASFFGANTGFSTTSVGLPGPPRSFASFHAAAEEAGQSRILGGIHFQFSNQDGLASGRALAQFVLEKLSLAADEVAPTVVIQSPAPAPLGTELARAANITITGQVFDNLSGVANLEAAVDEGAFFAVTLGDNGTFSLTTAFTTDGTSDGAHVVRLRARDFAGNLGAPVAVHFQLDTRPPELSIDSPTVGELGPEAVLAGTVSGTGSQVTAVSYRLDDGPSMPVSFDPAGGAFSSPLDLSRLAPGEHTLTVVARDAASNETSIQLALTLAAPVPLTIASVSPTPGSDDVGSTYRPKIVFSRPIDGSTLSGNNFYATDTTGGRLAATIVPAEDGSFAWLFLTNPMPGASTITVHVDGSSIRAADGTALDADGDGAPGGEWTYSFQTVSLAPLAGTTLSGLVFDPGDDLKPFTFDDVRAGDDLTLMTADDRYLRPLAGVKVYVLGLESQFVLTDAQGRFHFDAVPAGNIKLAIDGHTATNNTPAGVFFPEMVMDMTIDVGRANTVMGSMGTREQQAALDLVQGVPLPRLKTRLYSNQCG